MATGTQVIRMRSWCGNPYHRTPATRMGTGLAAGESSPMSAHAATPDQIFEADPRTLATRMLGFLVLLYSFYALAVASVGFGLWSGVLPGGGSTALTLIPGLAALGLVGGALGAAALARRSLDEADDSEQSAMRGRVARASHAVGDGVHEAFAVV